MEKIKPSTGKAFASLFILFLTSCVMAENVEENLSTLYVSPVGNDGARGTEADPLRTVTAAVERIAGAPARPGPTVLKASDGASGNRRQFEIILREGIYEEPDTLVLDGRIRGDLKIHSAPGEKGVISGGMILPNEWEIEEINGTKVWSQVIPDVRDGDLHFRQAWVNGKRATVPVLPKKGGFYQIEDLVIPAEKRGEPQPWVYAERDRFIYKEGHIDPSWQSMDDVWIMASYSWYHGYLEIVGVDPSSRTVTLHEPSHSRYLLVAHPLHGNYVNKGHLTGLDPEKFYEPAHYRIYNVREALSEPGEFYLDRSTGRFSYIPREGEDPNTAQVIVPRLNQLIVVNGGGRMEGLRFEGVGFSHSTINVENHRGTGNNYQGSGDAAIHVYGLRNSAFIDCEFAHLGEYALGLSDGTRDMDVLGNLFHDLGCGAIKTYGAFGNALEAAPIGPRTTMRIRVTDNIFREGGRFFPGHAAINFNKARNCIFAYNEVTDFFFTGVHFGAKFGRDLDFSIVDSQILHNHIHRLGQYHWTANDMGGIYINGVGIGIDVAGNVIHDIQCSIYGANGIYLDQQPCYINIYDNLVYNINYDGIHLKGFQNEVYNNIVYDTYIAIGQVIDTGFDEPVALIERNILAPRSSAVIRSKSTMPEELDLVVTRNLLWSLEHGSNVGVERSGFIGKDTYKRVPFFEWGGTTRFDVEENIVRPISFDSLQTGEWKLSEETIESALPIGFEPFEIVAGPRSAGERVEIPFKADNEALDSDLFQQHIELIQADQKKNEKVESGFIETNQHLHVQ